MFENILLWGILGYLLWRLWGVCRKMKAKVIIRVRPTNTIEGLLLPPELGMLRHMPEIGFLAMVKARFAQISTAFAAENIKCVKNFMTPKVCEILQKAIDERQKLGHKMDYKLVDFKQVQVEDMKNDSVRWIDFETEQVNLLRDKEGKVIEGDEMYLSKVKEKWQFIWQEKSGWILSAIETVDTHAI